MQVRPSLSQGAVLRSCVQNNLMTVVEQSARSGTTRTVGTAGDENAGHRAFG
jgi:hypothetical protein